MNEAKKSIIVEIIESRVQRNRVFINICHAVFFFFLFLVVEKRLEIYANLITRHHETRKIYFSFAFYFFFESVQSLANYHTLLCFVRKFVQRSANFLCAMNDSKNEVSLLENDCARNCYVDLQTDIVWILLFKLLLRRNFNSSLWLWNHVEMQSNLRKKRRLHFFFSFLINRHIFVTSW